MTLYLLWGEKNHVYVHVRTLYMVINLTPAFKNHIYHNKTRHLIQNEWQEE